MKKSIVSALMTALTFGVASTSFAANPFEDVPSDHWAYQAVSQLAEEGIIEGYSDGTYQGDRNINRYEMAQMVARAIAKYPQEGISSSSNIGLNFNDTEVRVISPQSRITLNKLAAEFREELDSLGVRIVNLEEKSDMMKWTGEVRYRYWNDKFKGNTSTRNRLEMRLFPTAEINDHWTAKGRFTAADDVRNDSTTDLNLTFIYAEGIFDNLTVDLGRMPLFTNADQGMVADDFFSGARAIYQFTDNINGQIEAGRWDDFNTATKSAGDYFGLEALYDSKEKLDGGVAFRTFKANSRKANILSAGAGYKLNEDMKLKGAIAYNDKASSHKTGYNVEVNYLGADKKEAGSWGAFVAYRHIGDEVGLAPTYDSFGIRDNKKGIDIGGNYAPLQNTLTQLSYFHGKRLSGGTDKQWFTRLSWFF